MTETIELKLTLRLRQEVVQELLDLADHYERQGCPWTAALARQCAEIRKRQVKYD